MSLGTRTSIKIALPLLICLLVLLTALVLAVFKPKGVTPWGARRQRRTS